MQIKADCTALQSDKKIRIGVRSRNGQSNATRGSGLVFKATAKRLSEKRWIDRLFKIYILCSENKGGHGTDAEKVVGASKKRRCCTIRL